MYRIEIRQNWCKKCYICIELCPNNVLGKAEKISKKGILPVEIKKPEVCTGCMQCELLCPDLAIAVIKE